MQTIFYVAARRRDGRQPSITKAYMNVLHLDADEAKRMCEQATAFMRVNHAVWTTRCEDNNFFTGEEYRG